MKQDKLFDEVIKRIVKLSGCSVRARYDQYRKGIDVQGLLPSPITSYLARWTYLLCCFIEGTTT